MEFDISAIRLQNQLLAGPELKTAKEIVAHFGAIQAQDYAMAKWAVGVRLPNATDTLIEKALDDGEIIRTHVLRPTWHLAAAEDIHWMLELTGANIKRAMASSNRLLELDDKTFARSNDKITEALYGKRHLTRNELMEVLNHSGIKTHSMRGLHLMLHAELSGIVCNGARKGKDHTYALLSERVKKTKHYTKEEALAELARRYFTSHGPATLKDFVWWSGLPVADSKTALELNRENFISREFEGQTYWFIGSENTNREGIKSILLLPAFDEFLISYKGRSASIHNDFALHAFTNNGVFKPIIVMNGQVVGIWKRIVKKDKVLIETKFFQEVPKGTDKQVISEARRFGDFMNKPVEIIF